MNLAEEYPQLKSIEDMVNMLKEFYELDVDIEAENPTGFLGLRGIGRLERTNGKYKLSVIGNAHVNYLTFHEFGHILLTESGRTYSHNENDEEVDNFLHAVRNMFDDYLIETEVKKQFGDGYAFASMDLRDYDLRGNFLMVNSLTPGYKKIMLAFTCRLVSEMYPSMSDSISRQMFDCFGGFEKDEFLAAAFDCDSSVSPEKYLETLSTLSRCLTGSPLRYEEPKFIGNPKVAKAEIETAIIFPCLPSPIPLIRLIPAYVAP